MKDGQATEEAFSLQKRTSSTSKHEISRFFLFLCVVFALLDPGIRIQPTKISANPCGSGFTTLLFFVFLSKFPFILPVRFAFLLSWYRYPFFISYSLLFSVFPLFYTAIFFNCILGILLLLSSSPPYVFQDTFLCVTFLCVLQNLPKHFLFSFKQFPCFFRRILALCAYHVLQLSFSFFSYAFFVENLFKKSADLL